VYIVLSRRRWPLPRWNGCLSGLDPPSPKSTWPAGTPPQQQYQQAYIPYYSYQNGVWIEVYPPGTGAQNPHGPGGAGTPGGAATEEEIGCNPFYGCGEEGLQAWWLWDYEDDGEDYQDV
jgi:hypothetical protein